MKRRGHCLLLLVGLVPMVLCGCVSEGARAKAQRMSLRSISYQSRGGVGDIGLEVVYENGEVVKLIRTLRGVSTTTVNADEKIRRAAAALAGVNFRGLPEQGERRRRGPAGFDLSVVAFQIEGDGWRRVIVRDYKQADRFERSFERAEALCRDICIRLGHLEEEMAR